MIGRYFTLTVLSVLGIFGAFTESNAQTTLDESRIKVAMRMIGHEMLLKSGDSTSRVLAIEKRANKYVIPFESNFQFDPAKLVLTVNQIMQKTKITDKYLVEVEQCPTQTVIYSYEMFDTVHSNLIPCGGRILPKNCYQFLITILNTNQKQTNYPIIISLIILPMLLVGSFLYFRKEKSDFKPSEPKPNLNIIVIGQYQFDKQNMILSLEEDTKELTPKETDLLLLLFNAKNTILEREKILSAVWGDEGNYVGRTLDVFISKLRKKLAADANLKIVNIRGVGYKFVVNEHS